MSVSSVSSKDAKYDLEKSPAKVVVTSSEITEAHDGVNRSNGAFAKVCPPPLSLVPRPSRRIARLRRFPGRVLTDPIPVQLWKVVQYLDSFGVEVRYVQSSLLTKSSTDL